MKLSQPIADAVQPVLDILPLDIAMERLVVTQGPSKELRVIVETALSAEALSGKPTLASALWLYVDDLDRSHRISQGIETPTGSYWHGIMHRREGDFSNSHYWFNRVGKHPAMTAIADYDAHKFIDEVAAKHTKSPQDLIARQRREWAALFEWCANQEK